MTNCSLFDVSKYLDSLLPSLADKTGKCQTHDSLLKYWYFGTHQGPYSFMRDL